MKRSVGKKNQNAAPGPDAADGGMRKRGGSTRRWLSAAVMVAVVFVLAGLVGEVVRNHKTTQLTPPSAAGGPSSYAVPVSGKPPVTLTVYEDMRDPASAAFAQTYAAALAQLTAAGAVNIYYREVAGVDAAKGGTGSLNAGNALGCAQDAGHFTAYRKVLLAHQPDEQTDTFADKAALTKLAKKVKGLDTDVFRSCVDSGAHNVWVKDSSKDFDAAKLGAVPVLTMKMVYQDDTSATTLVGGTTRTTPEQLVTEVLAAAKNAPTASPSSSPSGN
ncbi:DsbA family protein [Streptacidiphilus cavernicola]|uniref:DsbA family protein n=1 Tax=Streptacidiphilus cavernicola TaxID=3342716 RepID=A0ABV6W523_9ACTN